MLKTRLGPMERWPLGIRIPARQRICDLEQRNLERFEDGIGSKNTEGGQLVKLT